MGLGLTFETFIRHLIAEPVVALGSISHSVKDIAEMLYFYFSQLSLTACYVILFVIAVRFLLKKAPKDYSYGLWVVVYFKLMSPFTIKLPQFKSLVPQHKITEMYTEITPHFSALYSTEAGFVSIVDSEIITPPALTPVDPWYIPALIWFIGTVVILSVAFGSFLYFVYNRTKNKEKLKDNIYLCNGISTPFVLGIIRPKIFIPQGLTEQEQNYVITHEKSHIKHGDHIWKLIAFFITCIHWFNPLVWLSFFLLEKDMEMSCDERVMQTLGYEHKKDYSRCILSLATSKRFVPKAYLSFGDSDTRKRIKNVLGYKKPAFWVAAIATIVTFGVTIGMLTSSGVKSYPDYSAMENNFAKMEENFPDGSDRFHFTFDALQTSVNFNLPNGWSLQERNIQTDEYPRFLTLDDNFSDAWDIYNADGDNVGAMGFLNYTEYLGQETNLQAIYSAVALPNMYHFDLNDENYFAVNYDQNGLWETATTKVYHSPQLNRDMGLKAETTYGDGILSYDRECLAFVAFEFEENYFSEKELNFIATSLEISPQKSFESVSAAVLSMLYRNMETGTDFDFSEYVSNDVLALLTAKEEIAKHRIRVFGVGKDSYNVQVFPYERGSWLIAGTKANIKLQVVRTFRYNGSNFDSSTSDVIHLILNNDEYGKILITDYRIEGKDTTFADMDKDYWTAVENGNGQQFLDEFVQEYKNFVSNLRSGLPSKAEITEFAKSNDDADILYSFGQWYGFTLKDLQTIYENDSWMLVKEAMPNINTDRTGIVLQMVIDGRTVNDIRDYVKQDLSALGITDDDLRIFTQKSFHPVTVYCMTNETIYEYLNNWHTPQPRLLSYENLAAEIADKYNRGKIKYKPDFRRLPDDFVFPEPILWDTNNIFQNELGYYVVPVASAVGDNVMYIAVDDSEYMSSYPINFDIEPIVKSVTFKNPYINEWNLTVECAENSEDNKYVITYCDESVFSESGILYITNTNNFDITVHLISAFNKEIIVDLPAETESGEIGVYTSCVIGKENTKYTVGIHADVKIDTEINLEIWEAL